MALWPPQEERKPQRQRESLAPSFSRLASLDSKVKSKQATKIKELKRKESKTEIGKSSPRGSPVRILQTAWQGVLAHARSSYWFLSVTVTKSHRLDALHNGHLSSHSLEGKSLRSTCRQGWFF